MFDDFNQALATNIATTLSIIFACISFIKPFLDSIETGLLASRLRNQSLGMTQKSSRYTRLQYAKNIFKPRETLSEERQSPLVPDAQERSEGPESYELSSMTSAA